MNLQRPNVLVKTERQRLERSLKKCYRRYFEALYRAAQSKDDLHKLEWEAEARDWDERFTFARRRLMQRHGLTFEECQALVSGIREQVAARFGVRLAGE